MAHIHHRKEIALVILLAIFILLLVWYFQWKKYAENNKYNKYGMNTPEAKLHELQNFIKSM